MLVLLAVILSGPPVRLIPVAEELAWRKALPVIECKPTQSVLRDDSVIFYDERSMPPAYQDSIPPITGIRSPHDSIFTHNDQTEGLFSAGRFAFPWGETAGIHRCENVHTVKFLWLPKIQGETLPIAYWQEGFEYRWIFPRRTVVGEILAMRRPSDGLLYVFEIRTRTKSYDSWEVDVFRPFPRVENLIAALPSDAPKHLVEHLKFTRIQPKALNDQFGVIRQPGYIDSLPPIDDDLAADLLTSTPFKSCHGEHWRTAVDGSVCHCPTTEDEFSIIPANYDAGMFEVSDQSCARFHNNASQPIANFRDNAVLYGRIWGSDQVFSFHPFRPELVLSDSDYTGDDLRPEFISAGVVEPFDADLHLPEFYRELPR